MAYMPLPGKKCYIVSFEVALPATRTRLAALLKKYVGYCPINKNCWAILTEQSAKQVRDYLTTGLGNADRLFVIKSGTEAAWRNAYGPKNSEWLKERL